MMPACTRRRAWRLALAMVSAVLVACGDSSRTTGPGPIGPDTTPPPIIREMRGLWIATVANIDWPSRSTLTADQQRAEMRDILDRAATAGLNAVIFQVRPAADAVYSSTLEPWAAMLSGQQGTDPGYDPLAFAVAEAHARGLELHAWINPFRAGNSRDSALLAATHSFNVRRDVVRVYGTQIWLDPGEPAVHDHVMSVVRDIVQRYDIDAVHADDYFYPYPQTSNGSTIEFPDDESYARSGSTLARADWRRDNVNRFIERLYLEVHDLKPTIKVGISPFGIWRPGNPPGITGLDAYSAIYADSRKWLQQGWVDYLAPQLYWSISVPQQSFPALLDWWLAQNTLGRHVWPGLAAYRVNDGTASAFGITEIPNQITAMRARPAASGYLLYNTTTTLRRDNGALAAAVAPLNVPRAIPPAFTWLDALPPDAPILTVSGRTITVAPGGAEVPRWWVIRVRIGGAWATHVVFGDRSTLTVTGDPERVLANAIDGAGNASTMSSWVRP